MARIVFATTAVTVEAAAEALLLARSLRAFGGSLAQQPFRLLFPRNLTQISAPLQAALAAAHVDLIDFKLDQRLIGFPFAAKTIAAGIAEAEAQTAAPLLAWMDCDAVFLQEPVVMLLPEHVFLGYRPVDHTLIGSPSAAPLDPFWSSLYAACDVPAGPADPIRASVDEQLIRPYFNAGLLVVRPQKRLLRTWAEKFVELYADNAFVDFYEMNALYRIFLHQAVLAGVILALLQPSERRELPHQVNYPLHMHHDYPRPRQAKRLNDLISCRYDTVKPAQGWEQQIAIDEPLLTWMAQQSEALYREEAQGEGHAATRSDP